MNFELLETKRLILKIVSPEEMKHTFEQRSKPEVMKILGHRTDEEYEKEARKQQHGYSAYNRSFKLFLLSDKQAGIIIGRCGLHNWNAEHLRAEIGYVMQDELYKKKGLMTEAVEVVIAYGFNKMKLNRIEALVGKENVASLKLMEKFNFVKEGILKQHYYNEGKFDDSVIFARLREDYLREQRPV